MSKLSLDALSQRADQTATEDLLNSISGGIENDCHDSNEDDNDFEYEHTGNPIWDPIQAVLSYIF